MLHPRDEDIEDSEEEDHREIDRRKLFVTNVPRDAQHADLLQFFQKYGKVLELNLVYQKNNQVSAAIVTFENENDACEAIARTSYVTGKDRDRFANHVLHVEFMDSQHRVREFKIRKRVTQEDAENIYNTSLIDTDVAKDLCERDGYGKRTYYNIIAKRGRVREKYKRPKRSRKWDREDIERCVDVIEEHPTFTLQEIEQASEDAGNPPVSLTTIENYLADEVITYKDVEYRTVDRNSPETKAKRIEYVNNLENVGFAHSIIYIDEVGYSIGTRRKRGRAPIGQPAIVELPALQSQNVSVCCAVDGTHGLILHKSLKGSFTAPDFRSFIVALVQKCKARQIPAPLFIFDNCAIHRAAQLDTLQEFIHGDFQYEFLPPYSPNLNPIENVFGFIKERYNHFIATEYSELLLHTRNMARGTQLPHRQRILDDAFGRAIDSVSLEDVQNAYGHLHHYFEEVKLLHDI